MFSICTELHEELLLTERNAILNICITATQFTKGQAVITTPSKVVRFRSDVIDLKFLCTQSVASGSKELLLL